MLNFPLSLSFKILALSPQVRVTDSSGALVLYVKQKFLALKEDVKIFADSEQTRQLYQLKADRVIDWSAKYNISSASGVSLGQVRRKGARSIFKATYELFDANGSEVGGIQEENGWVRFLDSVFSGLPILGIFSGFVFHPIYHVSYIGKRVLTLKKQPAFFEGRFAIEKVADFSEAEESHLICSVIMVLMLERIRG